MKNNYQTNATRAAMTAEVVIPDSVSVAMADLAGYLEHAPDAPDRPAIRKRLAELGHDGTSRQY